MHSAHGGTEKITELLVLAKANVDLKDKEGHTAAEISRMRGARILSLLRGQKGEGDIAQMAKDLEEKDMTQEETKDALEVIKKVRLINTIFASASRIYSGCRSR